jgi:UDP-N-acetyl-D-mannosaminuronic acid dehydrogenase
MKREFDVCIIGGCGQVGLPLGLAFAENGKRVVLYDINQKAVNDTNKGNIPFKEEGAAPLLKKVLRDKKLQASMDNSVISKSAVVVMVIGTPVDEHLNPKVLDIIRALKEIESQLDDD